MPPPTRTPSSPLTRFAQVSALAIAYGLVGAAGLQFATYQENATLIWPGSGLALAVLLLYGIRLWPGILVGALMISIWRETTPAVAAAIAIGNTLEAVVGTHLLRRWRVQLELDSQRDIALFFAGGVTLCTAISATIGVSALVTLGDVDVTAVPPLWLIWWLGDAGGALVLTPLLLVWAVPAPRSTATITEATVVGVSLVIASILTFGGPFDDLVGKLTPPLFPLPLVLWAAVRFGTRGAATASFTAATIGALGTAAGHGPLADQSPHITALLLWVLNSGTAAAALLLGAAHAEGLRNASALGEQSERLALAMHAGDVDVWALDITSGVVFRGPGKDEQSLESWTAQIHPSQREAHRRLLDDVRGGRVDTYEREHRVKQSGQYRWVLEQASVVRRDDDVRSEKLVGIRKDVHERRERDRLREQERRKAEHRQRLESLGLLAGGIAHDFNNLVQVIGVNSELLRRRLGNDEKTSEYAARIKRAASGAEDLCQQMLDYAGRGSVQSRPVNLTDLVGEVASLVSSSLPKGAELRLELDPELPLVVLDPERVQQVLVNLVMNAGDSLEAGKGRITMRTGRAARDDLRLGAPAEETADDSSGWAVIEVSDDGSGMDATVRARIFDPFYTAKRDGRGLGLAISLGIIRSHAGVIHVESEPGQGTIFSVLIPLDREASSSAQAPLSRATELPLEGLRVLVVDDDEMVLELMSEGLRVSGATVEAHVRGRDVLGALESNPQGYDRVVADQSMPELSGLELREKIRVLAPSLPVVIVSGFADLHASEDERTAFLAKPFTIDELVRAVHGK